MRSLKCTCFVIFVAVCVTDLISLLFVCLWLTDDVCFRGVRVEHFSYPTATHTRRTRILTRRITITRYNRSSGLFHGPDHYIALVLMNLFSVVVNMCCMHHIIIITL